MGSGGYKGPPAADGAVAIAYGAEPDYRGHGYAKEAAAALAAFAADGLVWRWELRTADRLSMTTHSHAAERGVSWRRRS